MSLFSKIFKSHVGDESESTIELLAKWEKTHFHPDNSRYYSNVHQYNGPGFYSEFRKDTGEKISLSGMVIKQEEQTKDFFGKLKEIISPAPSLTVSSIIAEHRKKLFAEIQQFKNNVLKYEKLSSDIKSDSFFSELDHLFNVKLKILYNELMFCKFENLGEKTYLKKMSDKVKSVCNDMNTINTAFFDYMYALTRIEYENTSQDLEIIKIRVAAMNEAVELTSN